MNLETRDDGAVTIITVTGDLVIGDAETSFKRTVTRLLEEGRVNLLVDLSGGRLSRQLGLGALVRALTTGPEGGRARQAPSRRPPGPQASADDEARLGVRDPRRHGGGRLELLGPHGRSRSRRAPKETMADEPEGPEDEDAEPAEEADPRASHSPGTRRSRLSRSSRSARTWPRRRVGPRAGALDGRRRRRGPLGSRHGASPLPLHRRLRRGVERLQRRSAPRDTGYIHSSSGTARRSSWRARS